MHKVHFGSDGVQIGCPQMLAKSKVEFITCIFCTCCQGQQTNLPLKNSSLWIFLVTFVNLITLGLCYPNERLGWLFFQAWKEPSHVMLNVRCQQEHVKNMRRFLHPTIKFFTCLLSHLIQENQLIASRLTIIRVAHMFLPIPTNIVLHLIGFMVLLGTKVDNSIKLSWFLAILGDLTSTFNLISMCLPLQVGSQYTY
jgi:hypothetical protein